MSLVSKPRADLTHAEIKARLERGEGSVIHKGQVYAKVEDLPEPEAFAAGDPAALAHADEELAAEIARLEARRDNLRRGQPHQGLKNPDEMTAEEKAARDQTVKGLPAGAQVVGTTAAPPAPDPHVKAQAEADRMAASTAAAKKNADAEAAAKAQAEANAQAQAEAAKGAEQPK